MSRKLLHRAPRTGLIGLAGIIILAAVTYQASPLGPTPVAAAVITVNTLNDENDIPATGLNGDCALREAINNANNDDATNPDCAVGAGSDTIAFDPGVFWGRDYYPDIGSAADQ